MGSEDGGPAGTSRPAAAEAAAGRANAAVTKKLGGHGRGNRSWVSGPEELGRSPAPRRPPIGRACYLSLEDWLGPPVRIRPQPDLENEVG